MHLLFIINESIVSQANYVHMYYIFVSIYRATFSLLLLIAQNWSFMSVSTCLLMVVWVWSSLVLNNSYKSKLLSTLAVPVLNLPYENIQEFVHKSDEAAAMLDRNAIAAVMVRKILYMCCILNAI